MVVFVNGLKIKKERIRQGCSQEFLSEKAGITSSQLQRIEQGITKVPKFSTLYGIAKALKLEMEELVITRKDETVNEPNGKNK